MRSSLRFREGYATSRSGLKLYWRIDGARGPPLVCCNGAGVSTFFWEPFARRLSADYQVVRFDWRGHGRSDSPRDPRDVSIDRCAEDLADLLDALGLERVVLLGHSAGAQVSFELFRRHRGRVAALIPTLATYRRALETFLNTRLFLGAFEVVRRAVDAAPELLSRASRPLFTSGTAERLARLVGLVDPALAPHEFMVPLMEHLVRIDPRTLVAMARDAQRHDATDLLPTIDVPTLVVAAERDVFTPPRLGREMAEAIPGAELLLMPNATHAALIEQPDLLCLRVAKFLEDRVFREPDFPFRE